MEEEEEKEEEEKGKPSKSLQQEQGWAPWGCSPAKKAELHVMVFNAQLNSS